MRDSADMPPRQHRQRLGFETGQIVHMVVEGLQRAVPGVAQDLVETAALRFAGEERDSERLRLDHLRRHLWQHRNAARDMKAADADREASGSKRPGKIEGARKLVRL